MFGVRVDQAPLDGLRHINPCPGKVTNTPRSPATVNSVGLPPTPGGFSRSQLPVVLGHCHSPRMFGALKMAHRLPFPSASIRAGVLGVSENQLPVAGLRHISPCP